ncbi:hypothetical protein OGAPHI_004262 [Ogataea philodendri]|uniref:Uncharacterized protein n=1 Tax=Ogataea philodendri TaxID=1378263 RepID=A0A9P8P5V6_9ASCO|nr:uncharacterized protein OGAPHI_004262 [Ogataea philodendri]KAH3666073.1 hypothetical protein OGAPHI_004262 [Ogataea philodendri]
MSLHVSQLYQRNTSWDVQTGNIIVRDVVQVLDQSSQGVTVSSNDDSLTSKQLLGNGVLPVWKQSVDDQSQRLGLWQNARVNVFISLVTGLRELGGVLNWWRWDIVRSSPGLELFWTVLSQSGSLVLTLESTVVSLVQSPRSHDRDEQSSSLVQSNVGGLDGSGQLRCEKDVWLQSRLLEQLSSSCGFLLSDSRKSNVNPTSEEVLFVPFGLSVSNKNKLWHI